MTWTPEVLRAAVSFVTASLIALVLHEAAHVITATILGIRVKRIGISWRGPFIVREPGGARANMCIALAGPLANVLLAALFWTLAPNFAYLNLALGLSNLLPLHGSDGLRVWNTWQELRMDFKPRITTISKLPVP